MKRIHAPSNLEFVRVVCVCEKRGGEAWKLAARRVPRCIRASEYLLVCPDEQVLGFRAITPACWVIRPESEFLGGRDKADFDKIGLYPGGVGWYLQQIVKLQAAVDSRLDVSGVVLIWDADTVPLRTLNFIDEDGRLIHFAGQERHLPYFETMDRMLGLRRQVDYSFIAQCLAVRVSWVREFAAAIENASAQELASAVFSQWQGRVKGGEFSEYEMLGNFAMSRHRDGMIKTDAPWIRDAGLAARPKAGGIWCNLLLGLLATKYCYASFERWHRPSLSGALGILRKTLHS